MKQAIRFLLLFFGLMVFISPASAQSPDAQARSGAKVPNNTSSIQAPTQFCGPKPWRDVTCYGAIGDGKVDDSAAVQNAINDACANSGTGGATVRFPTPSVNYFIHKTIKINPGGCNQLYLLGEPGARPGGVSQFARAPRMRIEGDALPLFDIDNGTLGGDVYYTFENLDIVSISGQGIRTIGVPFLMLRNVGCNFYYEPKVTNSACIDLEGSTLWFTARDSNFGTLNHNTGPFNPSPGKNYDPKSWTPAAFLIYANSNHDGSILFNFDNVTWAHGGLKVVAADPGAVGFTLGEMIFTMNVIEGAYASPLVQFENRKTDNAGATLARLTFIESQLADVAHPTPLVSVLGTQRNSASLGSVYFIHSLSHSSCYVQGIGGHENISGIYSDSPPNVAYACDQNSVPGVAFSMMRHNNNGTDHIAPVSGPLAFPITENSAGVIRGFVPDGTNSDALSASVMLDTDGSTYLGPGGTSAFDLRLHRSGDSAYSYAFPVPTPTNFTGKATGGGTLAKGTYFLRIAAGDRNNPPFNTSAAGSEISVPVNGIENAVSLKWTPVPNNSGNKYTIYIGTGAGKENRAVSCACNGALTLSSMPAANQNPSDKGNLLADGFTATTTGFRHNFNTAFTGTLTAEPSANRVWAFPDAAGTVCISTGNCTNYPTVYDCGATASCSSTPRSSAHIVIGSAALDGGTPSAVTITGIAPAFTNARTYVCTINNSSSASHHNETVTNVSGSSFRITTADKDITDTENYMCVGY